MWTGIWAKNKIEAKRKLNKEYKNVKPGSVKISQNKSGYFDVYFTRKRKKRVARNPFLGNWW